MKITLSLIFSRGATGTASPLSVRLCEQNSLPLSHKVSCDEQTRDSCIIINGDVMPHYLSTCNESSESPHYFEPINIYFKKLNVVMKRSSVYECTRLRHFLFKNTVYCRKYLCS